MHALSIKPVGRSGIIPRGLGHALPSEHHGQSLVSLGELGMRCRGASIGGGAAQLPLTLLPASEIETFFGHRRRNAADIRRFPRNYRVAVSVGVGFFGAWPATRSAAFGASFFARLTPPSFICSAAIAMLSRP